MAEKVHRLEIFGDSPTTEDGLGFDDYADILLELIGNFDVRSPLTIGIHGRWGSGKTSLMRMLKKRFEDDEGVKTVWFNAWAHGRDESIGLALLQQIVIEFQKEDGLQEKGIGLLENVVGLGIDTLSRKTIAMTLEEVKNHFKNSIEIKSTLRDGFEAAIDECLEDRRRLFVFIDDLDRCLPEKAIEILEVIKLFLDVPKCIFVIGVEKEMIVKGIEVRYKSEEQKIPISGQDYLDKIIQIPFDIPPIRVEDMAAFIKNLGTGEREEEYVTIVAKGTGCNPRMVKLFLNVLRIRWAIVERTGGKLKPDIFAKLFVIGYVFSECYTDAIKYNDQCILYKLERLARKNSDEKLDGELDNSEILEKHHKNEDLSSLLRDEPSLRGIDIKQYDYLTGIKVTGIKAAQEVAVSDKSVLWALLSGDYTKMKPTADAINKMSDSDKQRFSNVVISKLKEEDAVVRETAAWALGYIGKGDGSASDALVEALEDAGGDARVREKAAWALGWIGDARAFGALKKALEDKEKGVRKFAAWALGRIGDPRAVEALVDALKDKDKIVRRYASTALGVIGDPRAVEALVEALKDEDKDVRRYASTALGDIGDTQAVEALVDASKDEDKDVCKYASEALEKIEAKQNQ